MNIFLLATQMALSLMYETVNSHNSIFVPYISISGDDGVTGTPPTTIATPTATVATREPPVRKYPPLASVRIGESLRDSGISTFCWIDIGCVDSLYFATQKEPIYASGDITAEFSFMATRAPSRIIVYINRLDASEEVFIPNSTWRWWSGGKNIDRVELPIEHLPILSTHLDDGMYLLLLKAIWGAPEALGDVEYGFLVNVSD